MTSGFSSLPGDSLRDPPPGRNIELKARLSAFDAARKRAAAIATEVLPTEHQVDTYFVVTRGRLKLREIDGQTAQLIWYQRANSTDSRSSDYLLIPVAEPARLKAALCAALDVVAVVDKSREIFLYHRVRIHLDRVAGRGTFIEFEAVLAPGEDDAAGHEQIEWLRHYFQIPAADLVAESYGGW